MPQMGRPRKHRKDLPPGLYFNARLSIFFYRKGSDYKSFGKCDRDQAIRQWVKHTGYRDELPADGTVAELIDDYIRDELPRRVRLEKLAAITADEYRRQAPIIRKEFGSYLYAVTAGQLERPNVLRVHHVQRFVRSFEGKRGSSYANRLASLLSGVFAAAIREGRTEYNPCIGVERNVEKSRKAPLSDADRAKLLAHAPKPLRLIASLAALSALRKTDVRLLRLQQIKDGLITVVLSKTGKAIEFEITPAVQAVLDEAATLPGRNRSMFVFPMRNGKPHSESALQQQWADTRDRAVKEWPELAGAVFRDIRTNELNEVQRAGGDATATAGHTDKRTTEKHYLNVPTRIRPRK